MAAFDEYNPRFNLTQEMLTGGKKYNWILHEDTNSENITGFDYSDIKLKNTETGVIARVKLLLMEDGRRKLTYTPDITKSKYFMFNGPKGGTLFRFSLRLFESMDRVSPAIPYEMKRIILNLGTIMYSRDTDVRSDEDNITVKYDSDIPHCDELVLDPQHYSISRILDSIGRSLKLACIDNTYINISQSVIDMILDDHDIGYSKFKVHVHDKRLINALTDLGYDVEILDNHGAVDCIRISGWAKGGIEND